MNRKVMKLALDALEVCTAHFADNDISWNGAVDEAVNALRAELAKPEPEPVAWANTSHNFAGKYTTFVVAYHKSTGWDVPLYLREDL